MLTPAENIPEIDILWPRLQQLEQENELLREQIRLLRAQFYGKKSEQAERSDVSQLSLFDEPESPPEPMAEKVVVPAYVRVKRGRKPLPAELPRVEVLHDVSEDKKVCACGSDKTRIGEEVSEQLDIIPARMQVLRHIRPKYACRQCEGVQDSGPTVVIAPPPAQIIPKSIVSAGLLAHILVTKFADAVPFYRQEGQFSRLGLDINRTSMSNWAMQAMKACQPLLELLRGEIRSGPLVNIDETTVQVLAEPGRAPTQKSYMWIFRGGDPARPALEFQYHPGRDGMVAKDYLGDYQGYVQTDGYAGYDFLDRSQGIVHLGCWAHSRRKFVEVIKAAGNIRSRKKTGVAEEAFARIGELCEIESRIRELPPGEILRIRQEQSKPLLDSFHTWLLQEKAGIPPKSLLGKAVNYTLAQWPRLVRYLADHRLRMDNNLAENAIRPFVVGRKNWLFSGSVEGASASTALYSLIETAKANGLEPYWYLRHIFERLPLATSLAEYQQLLPQNIDRNVVAGVDAIPA